MDGFTILIIVMVFCAMMSVGWFLNASYFKLASSASSYWAWSNFIMCPYVLLYGWRGIGPNYLTYQFADFCIITSPFLLRRGTQIFVGSKLRNRQDAFIYALVAAVMLYARNLGVDGVPMAVCTFSLYFAYNMGLLAFQAYKFLRAEFETKASLITVLPCVFMACLFLSRTINILMNRNNGSLLETKGIVGFNTFFLLGTLICTVAFNTSLAGLVISRLIAKIRQLTIEDSLTKIANRRRIESLIEMHLEQSLKSKKPFALVMMDVDHFKKVNDQHGHGAGDAALVVCANALKKAVRTTDQVGRIGGEEFCALLPNTDETGALVTAERMRHFLESEVLIWGEHRIHLTASFGVAMYNCDEATSSDLLKRADMALYRAKHEGRNRVVTAFAA